MKNWHVAVAAAVATIAVVGAARAITDTEFRYSSLQTGHYAINPAAMTPDTSALDYVRTSSAIQREAGGARRCFGTGLNLPQAAKLLQISVWWQSANIDPGPEFFIEEVRHSDGARVTVVHGVGNDQGGEPDRDRLSIFGIAQPHAHTVDNNTYSYGFRYCPGPASNKFREADISYWFRTARD